MKRRLSAAGVLLGFGGLAYAGFTPIPLNPSSFNADPVIEAAAPIAINDAVTATMDGGTNKAGSTWYEKGYNTANPATGIPVAGSTVLATGPTNHTYRMPPDYHTNNVILVGHNNGGRTPLLPAGTLTFTTPAAFTHLSFVTASGNGPVTVGYVVHYSGGAVGSESNIFSSIDWFNGNTALRVFDAAGRIDIGGGGVNNVNRAAGIATYGADVALLDTASPVTSIDFYYAGSGGNGNTNNNGRAAILAVSGSTDGGTTFNPVTVSGYNFDAVVEADGPQTSGTGFASGYTLTNNVTASMDGGIWLNGSTWFEKGYYRAFPNSGLPAPGSSLTSATLPATYTLPPSYATNCAVFVSSNITSANIVFATPAPYAALSFLCGTANGDTAIPCVVSFVNGQTEANVIYVPDWFNRELPWSYLAFGRAAPLNHSVNNTPDQYVDPFARPPAAFDYRGLGLPVPRLFDAVINVTNTAAITNISLSFTNGVSSRSAAIFAVSGAAAGSVPPVFGYRGTPVPGQPANARLNNITLVKAWEGTNNAVLSVTNIAGTAPISYQWKKAPRGGGLHDKFYSIDYGAFGNVTDGGRVTGSTTSALVISNALTADSADYLVVASNGGGAVTSFVATVMILSTNQSLLVGAPSGDIIANYTGDGSPTAESIDHASDQELQKWLSFSLNANTLPFVGPVGYTVTPISGASVCSGMRFVTANDSTGRDPYDYALEGSNDGGGTWNPITGGVLKGTLSLPTGRNGTGSTALDPLNQFCTEVNFANATGYKAYRVTITNNVNYAGDTLMQIAEIQLLGTLVPNPPVWVRQPPSTVTVYAGGSPNFTVHASGYPPPRYQWSSSGPIAGATNATYVFPNAQLTDSGKTFNCVATNIFGTITSSSVTLNVIPAPTQSYPLAVMADKALGYWRLDEGPDNAIGNNGVVARDLMGANEGYYTNSYIAKPGYNPAADPDTAAEFGTFSTSDSYVADIKDVSFAHSTNTPGAFSVEAWVLGGSQSVDAGIVSKGYAGALNAGTGTGTEQFVLDVSGGTPRKFRFLVRDAAGNGHVAQSTAIPYDPVSNLPTWHHLAGVCDQTNGNVLLYVDGLLAASGSIPPNAGILTQPLPMTIGARQSGGSTGFDQQWAGTIDDVAVYPFALSPSQVLSHFYAALRPPVISLQPVNLTVADNVSVTFYSGAYGPGTLGYQWYLSDALGNPTGPVVGQTSSNLTFTTSPALNLNNYVLVVTNNYGSVTSLVATLTVVSGVPSFIADLPTASFVGVGHVLRLQVVAGGTAPFTYQWQKNGVNIIDDYRTSGTKTDTLVLGYAATTDSGNYAVVVTGAQGATPSTTCALTVALSTGFFGAGPGSTGWNLQGGATINNTTVTLTVGAGSTARSAWLTTKQDITAFSVSFTYQDVSGNGGADGATFCLQNSSATALGGGGGGLGWSGITPSVALAFNIYDPNGKGVALLQNGTGNGAGAYISLLPAIAVGANSNPIRVDVGYAGTALAAKFTDTVTGGTVSTNFTVNIPQVLGASTAWVGFTGADGGVASTQTMTWGGGAQAFAFKAQRVGANLVLSWPESAGAYLLSSPALGPTASWTQDTDPFQLVGKDAHVTVTPATGARFFRLQLFP